MTGRNLDSHTGLFNLRGWNQLSEEVQRFFFRHKQLLAHVFFFGADPPQDLRRQQFGAWGWSEVSQLEPQLWEALPSKARGWEGGLQLPGRGVGWWAGLAGLEGGLGFDDFGGWSS